MEISIFAIHSLYILDNSKKQLGYSLRQTTLILKLFNILTISVRKFTLNQNRRSQCLKSRLIEVELNQPTLSNTKHLFILPPHLVKHTNGRQCFLGPSLLYGGFRDFLFIVYWPMNSYLIASVKSIMSDLFRSWPREGSCVYVSGLSQRRMRDVQRRIMAFTCPRRAAYQSCLAQVFDAAEVQMLACGCWVLRKTRIVYCKSSAFSELCFLRGKVTPSNFLSFPVHYVLNILDKIWSCCSCL